MKQSLKPGNNGRRGERGVVMLLAICSLVMAIPMVGLTVDVGFLYASKTRLQAAVDGASLAAARALSLGATTQAQSDSAKQNAVNWFYSNFAPGNWSTRSTIMSASTVTVTTPSPSLSTISVTASTRVPTYFMKWFHVNDTLISSVGTANRRSVVVMMVLDRSSSMNTTNSCPTLLASAKMFTGQFAAGRDMIGMVSFSDGVGPVYAPSTNFRSTLGFNTGTSSGNGAIDQITCAGGTATAGAITVGYNELYKTNLPGAYNILLIETDGLPNSLSYNFWDSSGSAPADPDKSMFAALSTATQGCTDAQGTAKTRAQKNGSNIYGWGQASYRKDWYLPVSTTPNNALASRAYGGFIGTLGPGTIGTIYSRDPSNGGTDTSFQGMMTPWHNSQNMGMTGAGTSSIYPNSMVNNCRFVVNTSGDMTDFKYLPTTDLFGNSVKPSNNYLPVTTVNSSGTVATSGSPLYMQFKNSTTPNRWTNFHNASLNATDHATFRARAGYSGNIPATVFVIGLGGNGGAADTPDYHLMQRWANDPRADQFNSPALYTSYSMPGTFATQPPGQLVFSSNQNSLRQAFATIASQILRLSQ